MPMTLNKTSKTENQNQKASKVILVEVLSFFGQDNLVGSLSIVLKVFRQDNREGCIKF